MNIALATRKALIATVFVPVIAMTAVSVESFAGLSGAEAQQAAGRGGGNNGGGNNGGGNNGGNNSSSTSSTGGGSNGGGEGRGEKPYLLLNDNCPPSVTGAPGACRQPEPRPIIQTTEMRDCSCEVSYRIVGGQRVAVKDCYIEVGETIRYCRSDAIRLQ